MNNGNASFQHLKCVTSPFIEFLYSLVSKPNLVSRQAFFSNGPMTIIMHMPLWVSMCLKRLQQYPSYRAEIFFVNFTHIDCLVNTLDVQHLHLMQKVRKKYPYPATKALINTQQLKKFNFVLFSTIKLSGLYSIIKSVLFVYS